MQKFIRVNGESTDEINMLLEKGWKVLDFKPCANHLQSSHGLAKTYAYVLLEKN